MSDDTDSQEMRGRWNDLWDDISHRIALFEADYGTSTPETKAAAERLAAFARSEVAKRRQELETEHPEVRAEGRAEIAAAIAQHVGPLHALESLFSHLLDGDRSDVSAELSTVDEVILARSGLDRSDFIAARERLRALIGNLPDDLRSRVATLIAELRRARN